MLGVLDCYMLFAFFHDVHFFHLNFPSLRVAESHTNHNHSVPDATQLGQKAIQRSAV